MRHLLLLLLLCGGALAAEKWHHLGAEAGLPSTEIQLLEADGQGGAWVGTMNSLCRWQPGPDGGKITVLRQDLRGVWSVARTPDGSLWIGTGDGVLRLQGDQATTYLQGRTVAPLAHFTADRLWAIAKRGPTAPSQLVQWDGEAWAPPKNRFGKLQAEDLFTDNKGHTWVTEEGNGVWRVNAATFGTPAHHLAGRNVTCVGEDTRGRIWCGLWGGGVAVLEGNEWVRHLQQEKARIFAIRDDGQGRLWVATGGNGLWCFDGKDWTRHLAAEGAINLLSIDRRGRVWVSTQTSGGLQRYDGQAWARALDSPLPIRALLDVGDQVVAGGVLDGLHVR